MFNSTYYIGLDPSLRHFGAIAIDGATRLKSIVAFRTLPKDGTELCRLYALWGGLESWLSALSSGGDVLGGIGIEEVAWAARSSSSVTLGKLQGAILGLLFKRGIPLTQIQIIPIQKIKILATGKGNAKKDAMVQAFLDRRVQWQGGSPFILGRTSFKEDIADAYFCALYTIGG